MTLIVIVDDRVSNRNIFAKLAATIDSDISVKTFPDPVSALDWLAHNTPDLVITDYKMPYFDGAEFIHRFRKLPDCADVPVIAITVYEERSFRLCALEAGATDFLHSPVDHHEFVTRARNLLKLHKHQLLLARKASSLAHELEASERSRERALRDSSERLAQVIDTVPALISATARDGSIMFANAHKAAFAGRDLATIVGQPDNVIYGSEQAERNRALDQMVFETAKNLPPYEEEIVGQDGVTRTFLTAKAPLFDSSGKVDGVLTSSLDITARKRSEAHLRHLAHHDSLTDLPNRTLLNERIRRHIARSRRGDRRFALHVLDLDGFKTINDLHGHSAGDRYIRAVSQRLMGVIRADDTLARIGGDEFAILQSDVSGPDDAADFASRILSQLESTIDFDGHAITMAGSIGIALHPVDGADSEDLLRNADLAMYRAKSEPGSHYCFYAADMQARARHDAKLDVMLRRALENDEFELYYQPQVRLDTMETIGAEALLRWRHPDDGLVSPGAFLARAEENGLIIPINEWVLRRACEDARAWKTRDGHPLRVGVNLSPVQFNKRSVPLLVAKVLAQTGLDPSRLDLELTESIVLENLDNVVEDLHQLASMGIRLSIDDFGTGYSSLSYVKRLPVHRLKVDQSFVRSLGTDSNDLVILRTILTLGHSLKLEVLAEGVETSDQLARLRSEGYDSVQGYYFGRPMSQADFLAYAFGADALAKSA